jgi:hypothetical protein
MLILVDATVIILLAEGSPTEKMSSLISLWTLTFDWKWPIGNEDYFLLLHFYSWAFWVHI